MNRTRPKQIVIRANEKEFAQIKSKVEKSKLTQNEYLLKAALNKEIIVIDGIRELTTEMRRIGTNVNQIAKAVNEGRTNCSQELLAVDKELKELWRSLKLLIRKPV